MSAANRPLREGQTFDGVSRFARWANFVKLPHTVFALPFALVGATLASREAPVSAATVGWIVLAFTAARFAAMAFNRVVDREVDARNPRTRLREIPSGALGVREAEMSVVVASFFFVLAAARLNAVCGWLSPIALAWVLGYSYTKRFMRWSHVVLGAGLAIAPVGGYLAVAGAWSEPAWMLLALAAAVTAWVAGFDILYALQDRTFDLSQGLRSIPVALGDSGAIRVARGLHVLTVIGLSLAGVALGAGTWFGVGVAVVAVLLLYEHSLVSANDLARLDAAFFTMNGIISIVFFLFVVADRLLRE